MPKNITELTVFVASPQDVIEEREILEDTIKEINVVWAKQHNIRLNLIKWETDVHPDIGLNVQDVINDQIEDYDIFIGIMWQRFGTPTEQAGSGTAEEFERAYHKYQEDSAKIKVMFYFNDAPISPSEIDIKQLELVNEFRKRLEEKGVLYRVYKGPDNFSSLVRTHLNLQLPHWLKVIENEEKEIKIMSHPEHLKVEEELEEDGLLDLLEMGEKNSTELQEVMERIGIIGENFQKDVDEITAQNPKTLMSPAEVKKAADKMAVAMDVYSNNMEEELPNFSNSCSNTINAYSRATLISIDFNGGREELENTLESIQGAKKEFQMALIPINNFKKEALGFPNISRRLNASKRHLINVMDKFSSEISDAINIMAEVEKAIVNILNS